MTGRSSRGDARTGHGEGPGPPTSSARFEGGMLVAPNDPSGLVMDLLREARVSYEAKDAALAAVSGVDPLLAVGALQAIDLPAGLVTALTELLTARG